MTVLNIRNCNTSLRLLLSLLQEFDRQGMIGENYMYFGGDGWIDVQLQSDDINDTVVSRWLKGTASIPGVLFIPCTKHLRFAFSLSEQSATFHALALMGA